MKIILEFENVEEYKDFIKKSAQWPNSQEQIKININPDIKKIVPDNLLYQLEKNLQFAQDIISSH